MNKTLNWISLIALFFFVGYFVVVLLVQISLFGGNAHCFSVNPSVC
jgi:hypothetical protein